MATAPTGSERVPMSTLLAGLGRDATARVRRTLRPLGIGAQQFLVLEQIQALGQTSQAELADAIGIDRSNLAVIAAELSDRDLVTRSRDEGDRRRYVLRLSAAGDRLLRRADDALAADEEDLLAPLDLEQREQLYGLLRRLADGVELCPIAAQQC
ncbi:MAG: MarR family transcriptional regulator, lower aerobic nicotinate degradation pathway regulator [Solirubrobacteraceae bacterium]|jgi:DNA-binding MarR family transcriptional regulator|nr:MarR family transcriptional regulator, lower aerobic nicotinate degradation pathway regulator [Solirubrobacteraceae bacterium]